MHISSNFCHYLVRALPFAWASILGDNISSPKNGVERTLPIFSRTISVCYVHLYLCICICNRPPTCVFAHTRRRRSWSTEPPFSRHQSSHRAVGQTLHSRQPSFSGCRFLHLELAPRVHRQRIYSTVISTSSENFPVQTFISGHSSVVNIFSGPIAV